MGLVASVLQAVFPFLAGAGERKQMQHSVVPIWQTGGPVWPQHSYELFAHEGYIRNEVVYACIEERANSASEPRLVAYTRGPKGKEQLDQHEIADLLERPNPFMSRADLIGWTIMARDIAGNAYWEKVRSASGKVVELWPLRPDRIRIEPDARKYIGAYIYQLGTEKFELAPRDVIHFKTRHPLDDFYGMPPLLAAADRIATDNSMRHFITSFFNNAGVPAGLLNLEQDVNDDQRDAIRNRFRAQFAGPQGWHSLLVLGGGKATYTSMGMPLGERGLVVPELQNISESRIAMVFGVPLILIGSRLGMEHNTYANYREARASFWDETLIPLYKQIAGQLNMSLVPDFSGLEGVEFDLGDVQALREDEDKTHSRARANVQAAIWTREEARAATGLDPVATEGYYLMPVSLTPVAATATEELADIALEALTTPAAVTPPRPRQDDDDEEDDEEGTDGEEQDEDEDEDEDEEERARRRRRVAAKAQLEVTLAAMPSGPALSTLTLPHDYDQHHHRNGRSGTV